MCGHCVRLDIYTSDLPMHLYHNININMHSAYQDPLPPSQIPHFCIILSSCIIMPTSWPISNFGQVVAEGCAKHRSLEIKLVHPINHHISSYQISGQTIHKNYMHYFEAILTNSWFTYKWRQRPNLFGRGILIPEWSNEIQRHEMIYHDPRVIGSNPDQVVCGPSVR